jgi:hypothetical protein
LLICKKRQAARHSQSGRAKRVFPPLFDFELHLLLLALRFIQRQLKFHFVTNFVVLIDCDSSSININNKHTHNSTNDNLQEGNNNKSSKSWNELYVNILIN